MVVLELHHAGFKWVGRWWERFASTKRPKFAELGDAVLANRKILA